MHNSTTLGQCLPTYPRFKSPHLTTLPPSHSSYPPPHSTTLPSTALPHFSPYPSPTPTPRLVAQLAFAPALTFRNRFMIPTHYRPAALPLSGHSIVLHSTSWPPPPCHSIVLHGRPPLAAVCTRFRLHASSHHFLLSFRFDTRLPNARVGGRLLHRKCFTSVGSRPLHAARRT